MVWKRADVHRSFWNTTQLWVGAPAALKPGLTGVLSPTYTSGTLVSGLTNTNQHAACLAHHSESESEVAQSCLTLCNPMDCSLPGFWVHGILQARILEWVAISLVTSISTAFTKRQFKIQRNLFPRDILGQMICTAKWMRPSCNH